MGTFRSPASSCWAREDKVGSPHMFHLRCPSKWNYDGCQTPSPVLPGLTRPKFPARALQCAGKSGQRGLSPGSGYGGVSQGWSPPTHNCSPVTRTGPGSPPVATPGAAAEPRTSSPRPWWVLGSASSPQSHPLPPLPGDTGASSPLSKQAATPRKKKISQNN